MKRVLNAPGSKGLKLHYDEPLSNFTFKFNLRRFTTAVSPYGSLAGVSDAGIQQMLVGSARHCSNCHQHSS